MQTGNTPDLGGLAQKGEREDRLDTKIVTDLQPN